MSSELNSPHSKVGMKFTDQNVNVHSFFISCLTLPISLFDIWFYYFRFLYFYIALQDRFTFHSLNTWQLALFPILASVFLEHFLLFQVAYWTPGNSSFSVNNFFVYNWDSSRNKLFHWFGIFIFRVCSSDLRFSSVYNLYLLFVMLVNIYKTKSIISFFFCFLICDEYHVII